MSKYKKKQTETVEFLLNLHGQSEGLGRIEVRAKSSEGPVVAREFCSTVDQVQRFADKYGTKDEKLAVYFGVGKRIKGARDGKKESILSVPALWSDIDVGKHGWDFSAIVRAFHDLPGCLQPSALVHSGGGLHAYWLLDEPLAFDDANTWDGDVQKFEEVNKLFGQRTGGDNVFDISRVLRLPGTYNARRGKECHVIWFYRWHKHSIATLADAMNDFGLFLGPSGFVPKDQLPIMREGTDAIRAFHYATDGGRRDWQSKHAMIWERTQLGGGFPYYGLDEAQLLATAYLWSFEDIVPTEQGVEAKKNRIVERVLQETKKVKAKSLDARDASWDWDSEAEKIRYKLDRWSVKWARIQEQMRLVKKEAAKVRAAERKAGKAANGKEG